MSLVETEWLEKNLSKVKIIDCSWHMPQTQRNGYDEYKSLHIPNSIFFDLDEHSRKDTTLPHMLVDQISWDIIVSNMGIQINDRIVIYDNSDVVSSCRGWFNFIYYGHDPKLINVLNGGLRKWLKEKRKVTDEILQNLTNGVKLEDGFAKFTDVQGGRKGNTNQWFAMVIMEGRTREVRRLWESQGLEISRLKRVRYGNLFLPATLRQGAFKELTKGEINALERQ